MACYYLPPENKQTDILITDKKRVGGATSAKIDFSFYSIFSLFIQFGKHQLMSRELCGLLSLCWWPLPLGSWCIFGERFPCLPAQHSTGQEQLFLGLQDQLFGLAVADCILESFHVFVLEFVIRNLSQS